MFIVISFVVFYFLIGNIHSVSHWGCNYKKLHEKIKDFGLADTEV
jgi:hypothetical protein